MNKKRIFIAIFILVQIVLTGFYLDIWTNANTTSRALPIITYYEQGTFRIDKYHELTLDKSFINGHYYTDKAPLPTLVVMPFFGLALKTGIVKPDKDGNLFGRHIYLLGGFLVGTLPFVFAIFVLFFSILHTKPSVSPVILAMAPFYASFLFVFAGSFFAHLFAGALLLVSYIFLKRENYLLSGIFAGLTFVSEYNLAVVFVVWAILMIYKTRLLKPVILFALGTLPAIVFIMLYNYHFSGSPFDMLYKFHRFSQHSEQYGFMLPGWKAIWGLSFSWYRGVFFFVPLLLLFIIPAGRKCISTKGKFLFGNWLVLPTIIYFLFISSFFAWWGGWTYGPRFFTGIVMLLIYEGVNYIAKAGMNKSLLCFVFTFGLLVSILAKITIAYSAPTEVMNPLFDLVVPAVLRGDFNPNNVLTIFFNLQPKYSMMVFVFLFAAGTVLLTALNARWKKQIGAE
jgi:hypothetical protein